MSLDNLLGLASASIVSHMIMSPLTCRISRCVIQNKRLSDQCFTRKEVESQRSSDYNRDFWLSHSAQITTLCSDIFGKQNVLRKIWVLWSYVWDDMIFCAKYVLARHYYNPNRTGTDLKILNKFSILTLFETTRKVRDFDSTTEPKKSKLNSKVRNCRTQAPSHT